MSGCFYLLSQLRAWRQAALSLLPMDVKQSNDGIVQRLLGLQSRFGYYWGKITWNLSGLSPKQDWSSKGLKKSRICINFVDRPTRAEPRSVLSVFVGGYVCSIYY